MADKEMKVELSDHGTPSKKLKVTIKANSCGISIYPKGYGECEAADGEGSPIFIEFSSSRLCVLCWDDINEVAHKSIDMEGARESERYPMSKEDAEEVEQYRMMKDAEE